MLVRVESSDGRPLQVDQVTRAVAEVAGAGSFLPMPQHSPGEDEYLRTHPSGENRFECALLRGGGVGGWGWGGGVGVGWGGGYGVCLQA
jgi:hypothetical protein